MFANGLGQQVYGPSQYATLDMVCFYGCEATGAGNCAEICQQPSYSVTGTGDTPKPDNLKWWILGAFGVVALLVATR